MLAKFPPHKNLSSKTWSPKFPLKNICFKKKLFPILPPPPQKKKKKYFSFKRICSPNISSQNLLPNIFALHILKKLLPKFCSPKIFAAQTTLWSSYGTWLIQVQWQGIVRCLQCFIGIFVICLKIVIEQKKTSGCCCFEFNGPLRQYFSLYRAVAQSEVERKEVIDERKNVQTTPSRTYYQRNRPLSHYYPN